MIPVISIEDLIELMIKYSDTPMSYADASLVLLAEQLGDYDIFTTDSDFLFYRIRKGHNKLHFNTVPDPELLL